jgi:hypothetical protein
MRLLTFLCPSFSWTPFSKTLADADDAPVARRVEEAVVAFLHVEVRDVIGERSRALRHVVKHVKWVAGKRQLRRVVLHSFTHLGGDTAPAADARAFLDEVEARLAGADFDVDQTPFGWFCSWELSVYGESIARVYKET